MPDQQEKRSFVIRINAGDLIEMLKKADEDDDVIRSIHIFADYNPQTKLVIQLTDKTREE